MTNEICILTAKDLSILEVMLERCAGPDISMRSLLLRKIRSAAVVFMDEVPPDVATMNSRVRYRVNGAAPQTRILSHAPELSVVGMTIPASSPHGLALLGLRSGQGIVIRNQDGGEETVHLEEVPFQPEAAGSAMKTPDGSDQYATGRPRLAIVAGTDGSLREPKAIRSALRANAPDDAGPPVA